MNESNIQKQCPNCRFPNSRGTGQSLRTACAKCSTLYRSIYFCWDCQRKWKTANNDNCGNKSCAIRAALLSMAVIEEPSSPVRGCPYFRACPFCYALVTHNNKGCKMTSCGQCHNDFCYKCLSKGYCKSCSIVDNNSSLQALDLL
ncbi:uncharacterized protein si:ch211-284e13.9 [Polypterus senegalus]|uniref:uncharacterized protein si:ch211-284e13.9 n=1 Tax=Polypterus senegalus TaxID=55291 RepID=UPI001964AB36|nr:uncharacterized protein si:ch211-284e13.9 [Polypterus senegalus]